MEMDWEQPVAVNESSERQNCEGQIVEVNIYLSI